MRKTIIINEMFKKLFPKKSKPTETTEERTNGRSIKQFVKISFWIEQNSP